MSAFLIDVSHELLAQKVAAGIDMYEAAKDVVHRIQDEPEVNWKLRVRNIVTDPQFQIRVEDLRYEKAIAQRLTPDAVIAEVTKIMQSNMADFIDISDDGEPVLNLAKVGRIHMAAVQEINTEVALKGDGECQVPVKHTKIKLYSKMDAIKQAAAILGMGKQKVEVSGSDGGPITMETLNAEGEAAKKVLAEIAARVAEKMSADQ